MIDSGTYSLLGVRVHAVDYDAVIARILAAARERRKCTCAALAVHGVMTGVQDLEYRYRLNHMDLAVPDGQPVRWGLNWLYGVGLPERVYGPELMLRLCAAAAADQYPVFFYGSTEGVLENLSRRLTRRFPSLRVAGAAPSRFRRLQPEEKEDVVRQIKGSGARIVFVGLGCPRQEVFAYEFGDPLQLPVVAVGAAFDFHAGSLRQAPQWMQRRGLEWLYRLSQEPRRLAGRYLLLNPLYLAFLVFQKLGLRRFDPADAVRPEHELLFA